MFFKCAVSWLVKRTVKRSVDECYGPCVTKAFLLHGKAFRADITITTNVLKIGAMDIIFT